MAFDPAHLLAMPPILTHQQLTRRDVIIYALGVGADELEFVYENRLRPLPMMAVVLCYPGFFWADPQYGVDWKRGLHGEQSFKIHRPLPIEGTLTGETRFEAFYDKGADRGALAVLSTYVADEHGHHIATATTTAFLRGNGGFGGSSASPAPHPLPSDRPPDHVVTLPTQADQALIYRLSGDTNPLHIDPAIAAAAGYGRPILHGLCSYGIAGRALLRALCGNDPSKLTRMDARFSAPVYPGETLRTEIWSEREGRAAFRCLVEERNVVALTNGYAEFYE